MKDLHIDFNTLLLHQEKHRTFKIMILNLEKGIKMTGIVQFKGLNCY